MNLVSMMSLSPFVPRASAWESVELTCAQTTHVLHPVPHAGPQMMVVIHDCPPPHVSFRTGFLLLHPPSL